MRDTALSSIEIVKKKIGNLQKLLVYGQFHEILSRRAKNARFGVKSVKKIVKVWQKSKDGDHKSEGLSNVYLVYPPILPPAPFARHEFVFNQRAAQPCGVPAVAAQ